ncbi:hypothetical protein QBC35DRAFT_244588 [Podospora australis]|uniref:Transmembrane protein n=1 Tax=Podospora australis TaxID=1536484 RepID=A0AAN7AN57_9PEZI|nr:hypothetical protein QBC35DRAFT_244588 [Podospora australis]
MSIDLDQVLYSRASWRKTLLVPGWVFQIFVLLTLMGIFAYRLAETFEHYAEHKNNGQAPLVEVVWEATNVGFNLISLVLTIMEIARYATERLTPFLMLSTHIIKLTLSFAILALDVVAHLRQMDGHYATIGLALDCGLLTSSIISFVYTLITYRRLLKYEDYHLTADTKNQFVMSGGANGYFDAGSHEMNATTRPYNPNGPYNYSYARTVESEHRRISAQSTSYPSQTKSLGKDGPATVTVTPALPSPSFTDNTPTPALSLSKSEVDRALGSEFGWDTPTPSSLGSEPVVVGRSGSVVGSGTVQHHSTPALLVPGPPELSRAHSWKTEIIEEEGDEEEEEYDGERQTQVMGVRPPDSREGDRDGLLK